MAKQYCTFFVDDLFFGVEVERVQEVIRYQDMTRVPLAPKVVRGLINLRGQIVMAVDLRTRLGLPPSGEEPMNVVIHADGEVVSLLVDGIGDVLEVRDETHERPPETLRPDARKLIRGVYKLDGRLLLILNTEEALDLQATA
jgi:purine-binding chemotaxis protein CheW